MKASFPGRALPGGRQIFGETKKAPFLKECPIKKGAFCFWGNVWVRVPTVPEKTVSRSFVFRLKLRSEKPRKRPIGCAFTRIRSKLTIIDGAGGGTRTHTVSLPTDFESVTSAIPSHRPITKLLYRKPPPIASTNTTNLPQMAEFPLPTAPTAPCRPTAAAAPSPAAP